MTDLILSLISDPAFRAMFWPLWASLALLWFLLSPWSRI